ncbi:MAG: T9SS type A sorting domain-containing protein [Bacteroidales bacterium]
MGNGKSQHIKPEISTGEEIRLWPVPAGDKLQISFMISGNNNCKVRITDISGREQLRQEFTGVQGVNNLLLQTSGLSNGNYVLDLVAGNRKYQAVRFTILRTP